MPENESTSKPPAMAKVVGAFRVCVNPVLAMVSKTKHARKILRTRDASGKLAKRRQNVPRVRFRLPKSKAVHIIQPFEPDSQFIRRWHHLMVLPLCYETWAFPFRLAFGQTGMHSIIITDFLGDVAFLLNVMFKCSTVVPAGTLPDQDEPIRSFSGISRVYLKRHFLIEFPPLILYYFATFTLKDSHGEGLLPLVLWWLATAPRMITRGRQLLAYFVDMSNDLQVPARLLESVKFALIIILSSHWVGCLLGKVMSQHEQRR